MRSISWIKTLLVLAICFTGLMSHAQIIKQDKVPNEGGSSCEPYIAGFITPNPPNPSPASNYVLEMNFDVGGFYDLDYVKEIYFAINVSTSGTPKKFVLEYDCCVEMDHGPGTEELGFDYYFHFLNPSAMDDDDFDCNDDDFVISDCDGLIYTSLTEDTPSNGDQSINYTNNGNDNDPVCPGTDVDILPFGSGLAPNCNVHRIKVVAGYYRDANDQVHPISKLYGDQVCIGNCNNFSACYSSNPTYKLTEESASEVKVYPNPVREELTIELIEMENADVKIFNINGELVHSQLSMNKDELLLDVSDYSQGIYIISVENEEGTFQKKFTKL